MADRVADALAAGALEVVEAAFGPCTVALNPFPYATSHPMVTVEVTLADGTVRHLVAKHLGRSGLSAAARRAKPAAAYDAGREPAVYADLLAGAGLGTAPLVGTAQGAWPGGTVLVVGRLPGAPLTEHPAGPAWEAAARWLGRLHGTFAGRARGEVGLGRWTPRTLAAAGHTGASRLAAGLPGPEAARLDQACAEAAEVLGSQVPTLVHGDCYAGNVVVDTTEEPTVGAVDWEQAAWGPGVLDLAALVAGPWGRADREAMVGAYADGLAVVTGAAPPPEVLERHLALAALQVALGWLGADRRWAPPAAQAHDWTASARDALDRLDGAAAPRPAAGVAR